MVTPPEGSSLREGQSRRKKELPPRLKAHTQKRISAKQTSIFFCGIWSPYSLPIIKYHITRRNGIEDALTLTCCNQ